MMIHFGEKMLEMAKHLSDQPFLCVLIIILNAADAQREATSNTFNQEENYKVEV